MDDERKQLDDLLTSNPGGKVKVRRRSQSPAEEFNHWKSEIEMATSMQIAQIRAECDLALERQKRRGMLERLIESFTFSLNEFAFALLMAVFVLGAIPVIVLFWSVMWRNVMS